MRYLHIISSLNPEGGGPADGVARLTEASLRQGHHVEIASLDAPDSNWGGELPCSVHRLGPGRFGTYSYAPRVPRWLAQNASRFDAVVVNGLWQYHSLAVWRALRGGPTPYFVFTHGMLDPWFKRTYPAKHMKKLLYWPLAEYRVLRDARAVLFTCDEERLQSRESFRMYRVNEAVAPYGTPGPSGDPELQKEAFLRAFPQLRGKRLLLFLGRIHPKKGCDLLIDAFANVAAQHPDLHLVIAGPDPVGWCAKLKARAEALGITKLTWAGMITGDQKWGAFHAADAFVLPSHQENFGIAVVEALACGLPVLISRKVNIWREIDEANAGLTADDTLAGTTGMLRRWLQLDSVARQRMAQNGVRLFQAQFRIDAAAQRLVEVMQEHAPRGAVLQAAGAMP
jgi:glycosyltransferase involved in cell wall biosynthesis